MNDDQLWEALHYALSMLMTAERSIEPDTVERAEIATAVHYIDDLIRRSEDDTGARPQVPGGNPFAGEQVPGGNRAPTEPIVPEALEDPDAVRHFRDGWQRAIEQVRRNGPYEFAVVVHPDNADEMRGILAAEHEHYWVDGPDDETTWYCQTCEETWPLDPEGRLDNIVQAGSGGPDFT